MFEYKTGDILAEDAEALVNTVNCVGVMGRGIALQFKNAFPENFEEYARACQQDEVRPGHMFIFKTGQLTHPKYIVNFPTKRHWRDKSQIDDIEAGLVSLQRVIREENIRSIAIPPLGCGLGGLDWRRVRSQIEEALRDFDDVRVVIFEPDVARDDVRKSSIPPFRPYEEIGDIEGYLHSVSLDEQGRCVLQIKDRLDNEEVTCIVTGDARKELECCTIGDVWKKRRISVFGVIHHKDSHKISLIDATEIEFFKEESELPSIDDIVDPDFTGGLRSEEYLEKLRNGELS